MKIMSSRDPIQGVKFLVNQTIWGGQTESANLYISSILKLPIENDSDVYKGFFKGNAEKSAKFMFQECVEKKRW